MELKELLKLAGEKPEVRNAIVKLANALVKKAQSNATTKFDETVPVMTQPTQQKVSGSGISGTAQTAQESVPAMVDQAPPASVVPPAGVVGPGPGMMPPGGGVPVAPGQEMAAEPMPQGPMNPAQEGVMAAQDFLAPVMQAAMNGDPNAQMIISQAAGNIARGIAEAANNAMQQQASAPAVGPDGAPMVGPDGAPVAPVSPEEQIANQIVPEQQTAPAAAQGGEPAPGDKSAPPFAKKNEEAPKSDAGASQPAVKEESGKESKPKEEKPGGTKVGEDDKEFKKMSALKTLIDLARKA